MDEGDSRDTRLSTPRRLVFDYKDKENVKHLLINASTLITSRKLLSDQTQMQLKNPLTSINSSC